MLTVHGNGNPVISIHTLRMEGDLLVRAQAKKDKHFNPHPPHGG